MEDSQKKRSWAEILKHPTANMIIGFLLTGVLGAGVTNYYSMKRQEEARQVEMVAANKELVATLASLNAERQARAEMLLTALEEGDTDSINELKKMYREAELRWKTESSPALMAARQVLPKDKYYRFRNYMEKEYNARFLKPMSLCFKRANVAVPNGGPVNQVLAACRARELIDQAGKCNIVLLDILYEMAQGTIDKFSDKELKEQKSAHKKRVQVACAELPPTTSN